MLLAVAAVANEVNHDVIAASASGAATGWSAFEAARIASRGPARLLRPVTRLRGVAP